MHLKVAFVVPRYGPTIRGGDETGARMPAERLVSDKGYEVEVLTTCALDAITWRDELDEGTADVHAVRVHRIRSLGRARREFPSPVGPAARRPGARRVPPTWSGGWTCRARSPALLEAVVASDADVQAFYPYLYYPTVRGLPLVAERAALHPATHEEPALHLPLFDDLFARCRGFAVPQPERARAGRRRASAWRSRRRC